MPHKEQRPNKDAKKAAPHFKSHYYDEFKQDQEFSKRPAASTNFEK